MSLGAVAAGRASGYVAFWLDSAVHPAAGSLLVTEAGGTVSDITGSAWRLEADAILATANQSLHAEMLSLIATSRS
jgi:fructose-1,6-bisphosphatase/inositol monophosphatase family enzyme